MAQRYSFTDPGTGLDSLDVDCVAQDADGYLWVGTENGLYQFDGLRFAKVGASRGMNARTIQDIQTTPEGNLLVGTTEGVFVRPPHGNFTEILPPDPSARFSLRVGSVFTRSGPGRFVLADRSGLYELQQASGGSWTTRSLHLVAEPVWSVLSDPAGALWFGCGDDLCRYQQGRLEHVGEHLHLPREKWKQIKADAQGHLWLRGGTHIVEIDLIHLHFWERPLAGRSVDSQYAALAVDGQGRIMASEGAAFGIWMGDHWRLVTQKNGLSRYHISVLATDRDGSIWIGMAGHGISRWVGQDQWESITEAEGLSNDIVWNSQQDGAGRMWIATESGLDYLEPHSWQLRHYQRPGADLSRVVTLAADAGGNLWAGTGNGTLLRVDVHSLAARSWKLPEVYFILPDAKGTIWLATNHGLYTMEPGHAGAEPHAVKDAVFGNQQARFRSLFQDPEGRIWAASDEALYRRDNRGWARIDTGLSGVIPHQVVVDAAGNLWASGLYAGLVRMRVRGTKVVECERIARSRLLSDQVVSLLIDKRGWLWVGQDAGVTIFDGSGWRSLTPEDGLIWKDVDSNGVSETPDGSIWIATSGGISRLLRPAQIAAFEPGKPEIQQIYFGQDELSPGASISWSPSALSVTMAALNFRDAHHIRIRYRLLGLETDWVESGDESVRYARLAPGHYTFQAETADAAGTHTSAITQFEFTIEPRWWQSWLFRGLMILLGVGVIVALWRWSIQLLMWQKVQLERAVLQRTRELEREKVELLRARDEMRHFAEHDGLSGLLNHRIIVDRLRGEVERSRREGSMLSIIMMDLDHFKKINDTHGHQAGDLAIAQLARVLHRSVRSYDWVGRYGGEEFLIVLPGSNFQATRQRAEQLRTSIERTVIEFTGGELHLTASFGVASGFPTAYDTMLQLADQALYRAKRNGRNCVVALELPASMDGTGL